MQLLNSLLPSPGKQVISAETAAWMLEPAGDPEYDPVLRRYVQYTKAGLFMEKSPEVCLSQHLFGSISGQPQAENHYYSSLLVCNRIFDIVPTLTLGFSI